MSLYMPQSTGVFSVLLCRVKGVCLLHSVENITFRRRHIVCFDYCLTQRSKKDVNS